MISFLRILCLLMFCFGIFQCKSKKYLQPSEFDGKFISFGNYGGFAGTYKEYRILENGQLFWRSATDASYEELESLEKKVVMQCLDSYNSLGLPSVKQNEPGNLTYFLESGDQRTSNKIRWSNPQNPSDQNIPIYYRNMMKLVKDKHPVR